MTRQGVVAGTKAVKRIRFDSSYVLRVCDDAGGALSL